MKKWRLLSLILVLACIAGCGTSTKQTETLTDNLTAQFDTEKEVIEVEKPVEEEEKEKAERKVVDGKIPSLFTGEWIDVEVDKTRPLAIMLNNTAAALPMSGVSQASVIYECPVEGRITRWMGVFEEWDNLQRIGSVRSCRLYYLQLAQEFDSVYCHFGQAIYAVPDLNSGAFDVLSGATAGIDKPASAMYDRISRPGKASEHTLYAFPTGIAKDIEKKGYNMTMPEDYEGKFLFSADGSIEEYEEYQDATFLQPGGTGGKNGFGGVKATFEYNEADHLYYRSTYGNPHMDELTNEQVAVTNVIFQFCDGTVLDSKDYLHFAIQAEMEDCIVFTNGKRIDGTWSNPGAPGTPARYYDANGEEIVLNTGKTFICIVWNDYKDDMVIQ